jgi:hypothetical protein
MINNLLTMNHRHTLAKAVGASHLAPVSVMSSGDETSKRHTPTTFPRQGIPDRRRCAAPDHRGLHEEP